MHAFSNICVLKATQFQKDISLEDFRDHFVGQILLATSMEQKIRQDGV